MKLLAIALLSAILPIASAALAGAAPAAEQPAAAMGHADHCGLPAGEGAIAAVDVAEARVTISHEAIDALGWTKATTEIAASKSVDLAAFAAGDKVHFLMASERKEEPAVIVAMCAIETSDGAREACMASMHKVAMKTASMQDAACGAGHDGHDAKPQDSHSGHH